jgi:putative transposase
VTDTNVFELSQPGSFADPLTEILRNGARALLAQAVEAEVAVLLSCHADKLTDDGRQRLVRHGHLPEREIMTGIGPVAVRCPRVRDRVGEGAERIRFSSAILPPYARRSKSLEVLIPVLYLKGVSTGDFEEALIALLGKDAGGLSASTISRLKEAWAEEHAHWSKRDLSAKRYVYFWVDGIHVQARLEDAAQCLLVIIGATPEGKKELVGLNDGVRESAQSWRELLLDLKRRGLAMGPELAVADGALGFWQAVEEMWPHTRGQRCWVHKTANVLNKLPKSQQSKAKRALQEVWMAETKNDALMAFDAFVETWGIKYDKAVDCLIKDRDELLTFYDFPAEHWKHLRTTNVIESSFATVRHRTVRSKGCLSNRTALAMIFKLAETAEKSWRRLDGHNQLPKVILGVKFTDGMECPSSDNLRLIRFFAKGGSGSSGVRV